MIHKKEKCQWVKKQRKKKCPICKEWFEKEREFQVTCNKFECAIKHGKKILSQETNKAKKEMCQNSKKYLKDKAQKLFNEFIRKRDKNEHCISCGHSGDRQFHAGHYRPTGRNEALRFNEDNCHKQCSICNNHLSGNLNAYRVGLIHKIGLEKVEELEANNNIKSFTIEELKEIIEKYKQKLKG